MKETFIKEREKELLQDKKRIIKELEEFAKKGEIEGDYRTRFPEYGSKEDENAAEVADYEKSLDLEHNLELLLQGINRALDKIKKGTYGICEACKKEIDLARLKVYPAATLCLDCKASEESKKAGRWRRIRRIFRRRR
jgi:DnaK suppressor protein